MPDNGFMAECLSIAPVGDERVDRYIINRSAGNTEGIKLIAEAKRTAAAAEGEAPRARPNRKEASFVAILITNANDAVAEGVELAVVGRDNAIKIERKAVLAGFIDDEEMLPDPDLPVIQPTAELGVPGKCA